MAMPRLISAVPAVLLALAAGSAGAIPVTTSFTAVGFSPSPAPTDPVSGVITWEAASLTAPIDSLTSVSLTIAGHVYGLDELAFDSSPDYSMVMIGGRTGGVWTAYVGTDDFWLMFDRVSATPRHFLYMSAADPRSDFSTMAFDSFSISEGPLPRRAVVESFDTNTAPEPSTLVLFAAGLAGLAFGRRRRQSTRAPHSLAAYT